MTTSREFRSQYERMATLTETRWFVRYDPACKWWVGQRGLHIYYADELGDVMNMIHEMEPTA